MDRGRDVGGLVQVVVGVDGEGGGRVGGGCRGGGHCSFWSFFGEGKGHSGEKVKEEVIVALDKGIKMQLVITKYVYKLIER